MKKLIVSAAIAVILLASTGFKNHLASAPKLYPSLDSFFKSVKGLSISDNHKQTLNFLSSYYVNSALGNKECAVVFSCPDNTFRSLSAEVFAGTWLAMDKYKKVKVYSCGMEKGAVPAQLTTYLTSVGYKVNTTENGSLEVKFSDDLPPLLITPAKAGDPSLPISNFFYVPLCQTGESCPDVSGSAFKYSLDFANPKSVAEQQNLCQQMAAEMYYAINKAYESYH